VDEFWQRATQILASGEPAVLVTVMAVHRQVPKVSPLGTCMIVTPTEAVGGLDGGAVDSLVVPSLRILAPLFMWSIHPSGSSSWERRW
jgi:hypothetical protein